MSAEYREQAERIDDRFMAVLRQCTGWFRKMDRCPKYSVIDYVAEDIRGRDVAIEVKRRTQPIGHPMFRDGVFIEPKKWDRLYAAWEDGYRPVYINFFKTFTVFAVWDLAEWFGDGREPSKVTADIDNIGYDRQDREDRFLLPLDKAAVYKYSQGKYWRIGNGKERTPG